MTKKPRLNHAQITKAVRLLDMPYKPSELAEELNIAADTILRTWVPSGLPYETDATGHKWINGKVCADWINSLKSDRRANKKGLEENHAYCFGCKKQVLLVKPTVKKINRYIELLQSKCPKCGRKVNRARGVKKHS